MEFVRKNLDISFKEGPEFFPEIIKKAILIKFNVDVYLYREYSIVHLLFPRDDADGVIEQVEAILSNNEILKAFIEQNVEVSSFGYEDNNIDKEYNRAVGKLNSMFPNGGWAITSKDLAKSSKKFMVYFTAKSDAVRFKLSF